VVACRQAPAATPTSAAPPPTTAPQQPSNTPEPAAPTVDVGLLYRDDFSDLNSGWPIVQPENGLGSYQDPNVYRLETRAPGALVHAFVASAFSDFSLQAVLNTTGGPGQWRFGFTFRQVTPDNYYAFVVNPRAQQWQVLKRFLGEWSTLAEGPLASPLAADAATPITLRLDALGPSLTFSVNGQGVVLVTDHSFAAGSVGFVLENLDESSAQANADLIEVRRYDPATVPSAPTAQPLPPTETPTPPEEPSGSPPTPLTPITGSAVPTIRPTVNLLTAVPATASAVAATANAIASQVPVFLTQPCGLPLLPACP
jgi:hypothetical protein